MSFIQYNVISVSNTETSSWHLIEVVCRLDTPKKVTKKRGYRYCYPVAIVSSVAWLGNLYEGIVAAARMMWAVTPASSFVAIMQQNLLVAARGANMVAAEDVKMMAAIK